MCTKRCNERNALLAEDEESASDLPGAGHKTRETGKLSRHPWNQSAGCLSTPHFVCYAFDAESRDGQDTCSDSGCSSPSLWHCNSSPHHLLLQSQPTPLPSVLHEVHMHLLLNYHSKSQLLIMPLSCSNTPSLLAASRTKSNSLLALKLH